MYYITLNKLKGTSEFVFTCEKLHLHGETEKNYITSRSLEGEILYVPKRNVNLVAIQPHMNSVFSLRAYATTEKNALKMKKEMIDAHKKKIMSYIQKYEDMNKSLNKLLDEIN